MLGSTLFKNINGNKFYDEQKKHMSVLNNICNA